MDAHLHALSCAINILVKDSLRTNHSQPKRSKHLLEFYYADKKYCL